MRRSRTVRRNVKKSKARMSRILKNGKKKRTMKNKRNTRRKSTKRNRKSRRVKRSINQYRKKLGGGPVIEGVEVGDKLIKEVEKLIRHINYYGQYIEGFRGLEIGGKLVGSTGSNEEKAKEIIGYFINWKSAMLNELEEIEDGLSEKVSKLDRGEGSLWATIQSAENKKFEKLKKEIEEAAEAAKQAKKKTEDF